MEYRLDAALRYEADDINNLVKGSCLTDFCVVCRQAQEGFNVCADRGFENFACVPFCVVCGFAIEQYEPPSVEATASKQGRGWRLWRRNHPTNETVENVPSLERSQSMTTRQRRARFSRS